jgi:uncharacterized protein
MDGQAVYSATDLVGFLACEHLTNLERAAMAGLVQRPMQPDPELDRIAKRGEQHEQRFLAELKQEPLSVVEIATDGSVGTRHEQLVQAADETIAAMRKGVDVIYQATFFDGQWRGHADFLRKAGTPSTFGDWSYEVWDTKLARQTKGSAILQLCMYTDLLTAIQGVQPEYMYVALGGSAREEQKHRFANYAAYYRLMRAEFLRAVGAGDPVYPPPTLPDPVEHCDICRWSQDCRKARRKTDDLSLVAGITARQRKVLRDRGVATRTALGALPLPLDLDPPVKPSGRVSLVRMREQARVQVEGEQAGKVLHELIDPPIRDGVLEANRGLLMLPPPSEGDLFFDIEGDPFALDDGVDYLFGVIEPAVRDDTGAPVFHSFWSIDAAKDVTFEAERKAFAALIDLVMNRLKQDPDLHVYHYAPYEPTAMRRLMGRYATREDEVDRLLRGGVFVDLYRAVRQGVRASVESYSIKRLEPLYGFTREIDLRDAGSSIAAFETWLELGGDNKEDPEILDRIEAYNRDDCVSTWKLRHWLEGCRVELAAKLDREIPRPQPQEGEPDPELSAALAATQKIVEDLVAGVPDDQTQRTDEQRARWLLAQLLGWHRREDKSTWWRYFYLRDLTDEERIDEPDAMGGLTCEGIVGSEKQSDIYRFRFPPQEHKIGVGTAVRDPGTEASPGQVVAVDDKAGTIDLKRGRRAGAPQPTSLVPFDYVRNNVQRDSLCRVGEWVATSGIDATGPHRAARDLLLRKAPRTGQPPGAPLVAPTEHARDAARRLVRGLDDTCLAIQGPPGSGKTTVGAGMIVDLAQQGKRIGVTANSHQVIGNLLRKAAEVAKERGVALRIGQNPGGSDGPTYADARSFNNEATLDALRAHDVDVVGGTSWLWSRPEMAGSVDVLFVDEAGQMSLANTVAVAPAGRSLVLLGDPQQLDQPLKGSHPPGAERSALAHILGPHATMPGELGLFLETTWRLHPDICAYISEVFYEGRLVPEPGRELQHVAGTSPLSGAGIRFVEVEHEGNTTDSDEEAAAIAKLIGDLLSSNPRWTDDKGASLPLALDGMLVVTPYNLQVHAIADSVPGALVGTVDKFQGQEAPISIYSMATSSAEEAPRGMEFLYSLNRLNVAMSRARCIAVVVANPRLLLARCRTPRQMRLANALARLAEMATQNPDVVAGRRQ